jgi:hypothetical protein
MKVKSTDLRKMANQLLDAAMAKNRNMLPGTAKEVAQQLFGWADESEKPEYFVNSPKGECEILVINDMGVIPHLGKVS